MAFDSVQEQLKKYARAYTAKYKTELRRTGKYASGRLARSVNYELLENQFSILANSYIQQISDGREPGKFPPSIYLLEWIKIKGIRPRKGSARPGRMKALAYVISRSIGLHGYRGTGIIDYVYKSLATQMGEDVFNAFQKDLDKELKKQLNKK